MKYFICYVTGYAWNCNKQYIPITCGFRRTVIFFLMHFGLILTRLFKKYFIGLQTKVLLKKQAMQMPLMLEERKKISAN